MRALIALITALSIPLMVLNMLGGIVAGIWLAILGEWGTIGTGVLIFVVSTWTLGFVIMPSMLLAIPAALCAEKGKTVGLVFFGALCNLYILAIVTLWCCGILFFFVRDAAASSLIPKLLWSYGLAVGPWAYMASKETQGGGSEGFFSILATFFSQLAYVTIMVLVIFTSITLLDAIKVFAGFMAAELVIQMTLAILLEKEMRAAEQIDTSLRMQDVEDESAEEIDDEWDIEETDEDEDYVEADEKEADEDENYMDADEDVESEDEE